MAENEQKEESLVKDNVELGNTKDITAKETYADHVEQTIRSYDLNADEFDKSYSLKDGTLEYMLLFINCVKKGKVLDIGSGSGKDAKYMKGRGFDLTCLDLSKEMVNKTREKGLDVVNSDMRKMFFNANSFDGIWANSSLIHLKKAEMPEVFGRMKSALKPNGYVGMIMREGSKEGVVDDNFFPPRHFSVFKKHELDQLLSRYFTVLNSKVFIQDAKFYFGYLLMNKKF